MTITTDLAEIAFPAVVVSSLPAPTVIKLMVISKLLPHSPNAIRSLDRCHWVDRLSIDEFFGSLQEVPLFLHLTGAFSPFYAACVAEFRRTRTSTKLLERNKGEQGLCIEKTLR
jgi:hypothetical protein